MSVAIAFPEDRNEMVETLITEVARDVHMKHQLKSISNQLDGVISRLVDANKPEDDDLMCQLLRISAQVQHMASSGDEDWAWDMDEQKIVRTKH